MAEREKKSGIYIHIPFCHSKCTYCSFITGSYEELLVENYISALEAEIKRKAASLLPSQKLVDTVYFGGGTPSIISPKQLERLLSTCLESFHVCQQAEITAEMNPSDLQKDRLEAFRQIGINRASVGIQSFIDLQLKAIGRDHSAEQALTAIEKLHASGFDNISIDLIAGLPDQTWQQWSYNLSTAFSLLPDHLSIYLLEIKEATTLYAQVKSGRVAAPDEDLAADMYELLLEKASLAGYDHYEISNFAKDREHRSRHNVKYWTDLPYFGFGVSAHSYDGEQRYSNVKSTHDYINRISQGLDPSTEKIKLNDYDQAREAFMLQLRMMDGVDRESFSQAYDIDLVEEYKEELDRLVDAELLEVNDKTVKLTKRGILYSNEVFILFV